MQDDAPLVHPFPVYIKETGAPASSLKMYPYLYIFLLLDTWIAYNLNAILNTNTCNKFKIV